MANTSSTRVLITPVFTVSYPTLLEPKPFMENGKPKGDPVYTVEAIFAAGDMDKFKELDEETGEFVPVELARVCAAAAKEMWPDINLKEAVAHGGIAWPITDGAKAIADKVRKGKKAENLEHYEGTKVINFKAKQDYPPKLYYMDGKVRKMIDRTSDHGKAVFNQKFYAGAQAFAEITVKAGVAGQNKYVTCYVNSVRFVKDGTKLGGTSLMDRFDGIQGGQSDYDPTGDLDDEIPF